MDGVGTTVNREAAEEVARRSPRERLGLRGELMLALLPSLTVLAVLALLELLGSQRLLFASLASSAFLVYRDPAHQMNTVRALVASHTIGVVSGLLAAGAFGPGYLAAGSAMIVTISLMIMLDVAHPPAVSTALAFAFSVTSGSAVALFGVALVLLVVLVVLQRLVLIGLVRAGYRS